MGNKRSTDPERIERLKEELDKKSAVLEAMKTAFFNRTTFKNKIPEYEDLHNAAEEFIRANYELQKATFGRIRLKFRVPDVLRD